MQPSLWKSTFLVAGQELRSMYRDRQTVMYTVLVPLGLYPLVLWCLMQGYLYAQGREEQTQVRVGLAAPAEVRREDRVLARVLRTDPTRVPQLALQGPAARAATGADQGIAVERRVEPLGEAEARTWLREGAPPGALIPLSGAEEPPDAVLTLPAARAGEEGEPRSRLFFDSVRASSRLAVARVSERLEPYVTALRERAALERGHSPTALVPFEVEHSNVAPGRAMVGYALSFVLPMLLVIMCVMGAFFPAVDVTAGEKERHTAETTLSLPLPRMALHQGKILAVCAAAVLATGLNLLALALSAGHLMGVLSVDWMQSFGELPLLAFLAIAPLAVLFAFLVSALLCGIAAFAGSFREGQALLGPVQLLFMMPATVGVIPGVQLTPLLATIPVVNVVLAFRALLLGEVLLLEYVLTALSLLAAALLAVRVSVHLLSRESLLLSGRGASPVRFLRLLRSPAQSP